MACHSNAVRVVVQIPLFGFPELLRYYILIGIVLLYDMEENSIVLLDIFCSVMFNGFGDLCLIDGVF